MAFRLASGRFWEIVRQCPNEALSRCRRRLSLAGYGEARAEAECGALPSLRDADDHRARQILLRGVPRQFARRRAAASRE
jgi:hypothetical protein